MLRMEMFRAVLFDMDGVVIDTQQSVTDFWQLIAAEQGVTLTAKDFEQHIFGVQAVATLRALFPGLPPEQDEAFHERINGYERELRYSELVGVTSFLRLLKSAGAKTALVTSGSSFKVAEVCRQLGLDGMFDEFVTAEDVVRGKPDPSCYLAAAHKLQVSPSECVVFEDAVSGVRAAKAAGMACVGVQSGRLADLLVAEGVRHVIPDFTAARLEFSDDGSQLRLGEEFALCFAKA